MAVNVDGERKAEQDRLGHLLDSEESPSAIAADHEYADMIRGGLARLSRQRCDHRPVGRV